jgi:hypothetical protein
LPGCDFVPKLADFVRQGLRRARLAIMSEFKFACPVCGQHITCDSRSSGTQMECPTCFRKLVVPQASKAGSPNLVLTASEVSTRPLPQSGAVELLGASKKQFPFAAVAFLIVLSAVAGGAYMFRDQILKAVQNGPPAGKDSASKKTRKVVAPPANDTNWTLHLANVKFPETPAAGRIRGDDFLVQRATLQGGTLNFRQGANWPPELGLTVNLFANRGEDLAGQAIQIEATRTNAPRVVLRWKNDLQEPATKSFHTGYALRLEFGQASGTRMPGKIYLCTPDEAKSYLAGTFTAEIRKPSPPKTTSSQQKPKQ